MARKVYVDIKISVILNMDDDASLENVVNTLVSDISLDHHHADLLGTELVEYDLTDSK